MDLGPALAPAPANIDALRRPDGLYERRFQRGMVVINPDGQPHPLPLAGTVQLVHPIGGVALNFAADTTGWSLQMTTVSGSLDIPGHGAAVLLGAWGR